jgi:DNA-directed RNA polymerase beta' subunit
MEMNMHMPQNIAAETELRHLAAIPFQQVSPTSNTPIIGIFQDSLLGSYRFTRPNITFNPRSAMNLLVKYPHVDTDAIRTYGKEITSFQILSQIFPKMTLKYKTKLFKDGEDPNTSNNVLEIRNGEFVRGQMEKSVLGSGSKGILHRICNDFGHLACADFNDNLQAIITEYMKTSSYSVGMSDLMADKTTQEKIIEVIEKQKRKAQHLMDKVHLGIFENNTANTNASYFETEVNNILNEATNEAGKVGNTSLSKDNRFVTIVESGSKGTAINITQMISCLGQQNVDGKRIPYGFDSRTLPHYTKFDDSPNARGFVENSYISGLTAPELFFHAMGGRIGLIDTACKSVTWETPIVVIVDGYPIYTEIGKWIDNQLSDETKHDQIENFPNDRNMELLKVKDVYIPTTDEDGKVTWGEVTAVTRHDPGNQLYEVITLSGRKVTVAESQSLLIWDKETSKFVPKLSSEVGVGDFVPVTTMLQEAPVTLESVDLTKQHGETLGTSVAKEWNEILPTSILLAPKEYIIGFLSGYCSHHAIFTTKSLIISCPSVNVMELVSMLCSTLGIFSELNSIECTIKICGKWGQLFSDTIPLMDDGKQKQLNAISWNSSSFQSHNNIVFDPITSITPIGVDGHPKLYDLSVPSTLNFNIANGLGCRDTASTGYIQRRLVKGLEDLKVEYDMSVRNNMGKIIQFTYGDDGFDSTKVEGQQLPLLGMGINDIYQHFDMSDEKIYTPDTLKRVKTQKEEFKVKILSHIETMIEARDYIVTNIFRYKNEAGVTLPVAFQYLIGNIHGQLNIDKTSAVDITPMEAFELTEEYLKKMNSGKFMKTNYLWEAMYRYYLSPRELLVFRRFHRRGLILLLETILLKFKEAVIHPGEMVGVVAAQGIGEPSTQLTLNSVTYETEILVKDQQGIIQKVQIGDFNNDWIKKSKKIEYMQEKDTTYAELDEYYEVPCATEDGQTVWRRIEAVTKHPVINEDGTNTMLKITTKGCREVTVTKAKSVLQLVDGKLQHFEGGKLKVGDYLPCSRRQLDHQELHVLDLKQILPPTQYIYGSEMEKAKAVVDEHQWWKKHAGKTFTLPYSRSDSAYASLKQTNRRNTNKSVDYESGYVYTKTNNICNYKIPELIDLDYDFGYLCGAFCAEGCFTKHQISIANIDENYYIPIQRICKKFNLTTKCYTHNNKSKEGWTSKDIRIYSTVMCRILEKLCGKYSHGKFVSPLLVFSNKDCIRGFLDAYISGDGCVYHNCITATSVSPQLLLDVQIMMKQLGVTAKIHKNGSCRKDVVFPTYTTKLENIHQPYLLTVPNQQCSLLANQLNLSIEQKQAKVLLLRKRPTKYEYCRDNLVLPNIVNDCFKLEPRNGRMLDLEFDKIVSIEEISNTTPYAYDLTVEDTRNFDCYNGVCCRDTFHSSGVGSKSNVTRGVPRIEEILRLTKNPKNATMSVYLNALDEGDKDRASMFASNLSHTKLQDMVKAIQICFDPNETVSNVLEDQVLIDQFYAFENMMKECIEDYAAEQNQQSKSKWIVRMEMDTEKMLDANITMDDIHFAVANSQYGADVHCVFSDYNMDKLVFRIRLNSSVFNKTRKRNPEPLDQSDEIYLLKQFQDQLLNNVVLRGVNGIKNVQVRKLQNMVTKQDGKFVPREAWYLDTTGSNLLDTLGLPYIDYKRSISNDIKEVFNVLGIEAARQIIYNEINEVMEFSGVYINYHHTSLLCDRMTCNKDMVSIFRSGLLNDNVGPIAKATFEVHTEVLLAASRHAEFDPMRGVSANILCGQNGCYGTGAFGIVLDMKAMETQDANPVQDKVSLDDMSGSTAEEDAVCLQKKITINNNISNIKIDTVNRGVCLDNYDAGF